MRRIAAIFLFLVFGAASAYAADATGTGKHGKVVSKEDIAETSKIISLLNTLDTPGITFIRNGEKHDGAWAKNHLQNKLAAAGEKVKTADDFITQIGSGSVKSGKPYQIKTKDGETVKSADWFKAHLAEINKGSKG